jgi:pseudaminic acid synthase
MQIGKFKINKSSKTFIIAELSANHGGSLKTALDTVRAAAKAGADCIKIQTYRADTITLNSNKDDFKIKGTIWNGQNLFKLYEEAHTPWEWHEPIMKLANELGLECFSSPFDFSAVDYLENLKVPAYKIASFEITDIPLIKYVAEKQKPIILSTGIAAKEDIELAIQTCFQAGNKNIALLKCTSSYPAPVEEANLSLIKSFQKDFELITGLSDHTLTNTAAIASILLGGKIIEKHFILDHSIGGPDASFSLDFKEFSDMVKSVREAEKCLGSGTYDLTSKQKSGKVFSKSLYVSANVSKGDIISPENIKSVRPGYGLHPKFFKDIIGKKFKFDLELGDRLEWKHIENS